MYPCPNCHQESISAWDKTNATSTFPRKCKSCKQHYYVSGWGLASVVLSTEVLLWVSIISALVLKTPYALLVFPLGMTFSHFIFVKVAKLKPIDDKEIRKSRLIAISMVLILITLGFVI